MDAFGDDEPARCGATLTGLEERAVDRHRHCGGEVGVVEHHERVLASHLELHTCSGFHRRGRYRGADILRTGEAHCVHIG